MGRATTRADGASHNDATNHGKGASRLADVDPAFLKRLERGDAETRTLMESLAIDQRALMRTLIAREGAEPLTRAERATLAPDVAITRRVRAGAALIRERFGPGALDRFLDDPSDTVRAWAVTTLALDDETPVAPLLESVRPYADDPHSGLREWAWLAVRHAIIRDIDDAIAALTPWVTDPSPNIRRFATEATRPRGVWCPHIRALRDDPAPAEPLLHPLRADASKYVQDSVANWLNDASKDTPDWVRSICEQWGGSRGEPSENANTARICRRALRTLSKQAATPRPPMRRR